MNELAGVANGPGLSQKGIKMFDLSCHLNRKVSNPLRVASYNRANNNQLDIRVEDHRSGTLEITLFDVPGPVFENLISLLADDETINYARESNG